jgi:hypothetical protein
MVDSLKSLYEWVANEWRDREGFEAVETPSAEEAHFVLRYDGTDVAELWLSGGEWHFEYTEHFRKGSDLEPLVEFPDPEKKYVDEDLWAFFTLRIPSPKRPSIRKVVEEEGIDVNNEVELLRRFGRKTIDDPFLLQPAP